MAERADDLLVQINGMESKASKGGWTLGQVPYGFARDSDDTLAPIEDEIGVVKQVFHLYTRRRLGCRAVATYLNERGLWRRCAHRKASTEPSTQPWSHQTVADVLTNRVYLGEVQIRQLGHRRDELAFLIEAASDEPTDTI